LNARSWLLVAGVLACSCSTDSSPLPALPDLSKTEAQVADRIREFAATVREASESAEAWGRLGAVLDAHGFRTEAEPCYRRALEIEPRSFEWNYHLAIVLDRQGGELDEIARLFEAAARLRPDYAPLHYRHAQALSRRGKNEEARRRLERAIELDETFAAGHRALGQLLLLLDDAPNAVRQLERAATLDPRDEATRAALARALMMNGDPDAARKLAARAGDARAKPRIQDPVRSEVDALNTSATAVAARARAALGAGRFEEALELFLLSDEWKPGSANVQYNLGVCYLRLGKREQARARFQKAVSIANEPEALWRLGLLSLEDGDRDLALERLRLANERAPEDGSLLARIATGIARAGRPGDALPLFERATELGPDGAGLRGNWGAALLELGRADEALEQFRRAIDLDPDQTRAYLNAGVAMESLGNVEGAERFYREALARDPQGPARQRLDRLELP